MEFRKYTGRRLEGLRNLSGYRLKVRKSKNNNKYIGIYGETLSIKFLRSCKYNIIEKNWRCKYGELDIVYFKGKTLCFAEVKTRNIKTYEDYNESASMNYQKRKRLKKLEYSYFKSNSLLIKRLQLKKVRFDLIVVLYDERILIKIMQFFIQTIRKKNIKHFTNFI